MVLSGPKVQGFEEYSFVYQARKEILPTLAPDPSADHLFWCRELLPGTPDTPLVNPGAQ
jgi:hypothetical protein